MDCDRCSWCLSLGSCEGRVNRGGANAELESFGTLACADGMGGVNCEVWAWGRDWTGSAAIEESPVPAGSKPSWTALGTIRRVSGPTGSNFSLGCVVDGTFCGSLVVTALERG